jgi:hypothetical protein
MPTVETEPTLSGDSLRAALKTLPAAMRFNEAQSQEFLQAVADSKEKIQVRSHGKEGMIRRKGESDLSFCIILKGSVTLMRKIPRRAALEISDIRP